MSISDLAAAAKKNCKVSNAAQEEEAMRATFRYEKTVSKVGRDGGGEVEKFVKGEGMESERAGGAACSCDMRDSLVCTCGQECHCWDCGEDSDCGCEECQAMREENQVEERSTQGKFEDGELEGKGKSKSGFVVWSVYEGEVDLYSVSDEE
jgi:hypothetical protein